MLTNQVILNNDLNTWLFANPYGKKKEWAAFCFCLFVCLFSLNQGWELGEEKEIILEEETEWLIFENESKMM